MPQKWLRNHGVWKCKKNVDIEDGGRCLGCQPRCDGSDGGECTIRNCGICCNGVTNEEESLQCDQNSVWPHNAFMSSLVCKSLYKLLKMAQGNFNWYCDACLSKLVSAKDENEEATGDCGETDKNIREQSEGNGNFSGLLCCK